MKQNNLFRLLFVSFLLTCALNSRSLDEIQEDGNIIVAIYENFPPYSYIEDKIAKGIDIDIAEKIAKKIGVKVKLYWTGSDETLDDDLRNVIWKGHLIHKTKADVMFRVPYDYDFIRETDKQTGELNNKFVVIKSPYHSESWVIVTRKNQLPNISNLVTFKNNSIGVEIDTFPDLYLTSIFNGILKSEIVHYKKFENSIEDFKNKKIDAVAGLKSQLEFALDFKNNKDVYLISKGMGDVVSKWDLGVAVRSDYRALSYTIDGYMEELYKEGEIQKIFDKYGVNYEKPLVHQNNPHL